MARAAIQRRLTWQFASVDNATDETPRVRTLTLGAPDWSGHRAGQHLDVRLTAEDGYQAEREYSVASAPGEPVAITVERLEDGEVSPYLTRELRVGDELEIRGPIGGYFVWAPEDGGPLMLIAGGSGVVPLRAMLRYRQLPASTVPARLLYSARTLPDVIYAAELACFQQNDGVDVIVTLTREQPPGWTGRTGRVDAALLSDVAWPASEAPLAYVCGPTSFVGGQFDQLGGIRADLLLGRGRQVLWLGEWLAHTASLPAAVRAGISSGAGRLALGLGLVGLEPGWPKRASATACEPPRCSQCVPGRSGSGENAEVRAQTCRDCHTVGSARSQMHPSVKRSYGGAGPCAGRARRSVRTWLR